MAATKSRVKAPTRAKLLRDNADLLSQLEAAYRDTNTLQSACAAAENTAARHRADHIRADKARANAVAENQRLTAEVERLRAENSCLQLDLIRPVAIPPRVSELSAQVRELQTNETNLRESLRTTSRAFNAKLRDIEDLKHMLRLRDAEIRSLRHIADPVHEAAAAKIQMDMADKIRELENQIAALNAPLTAFKAGEIMPTGFVAPRDCTIICHVCPPDAAERIRIAETARHMGRIEGAETATAELKRYQDRCSVLWERIQRQARIGQGQED